MIDTIKPYSELIAYHTDQANRCPSSSGMWKAHQNIKNELLHWKHGKFRLTAEQALTLLQEKIRQQLHYLYDLNEYDRDMRMVYMLYLAHNSKVPYATPEGVYDRLMKYIVEEQFSSFFQAMCYGIFYRTITNHRGELRRDITIAAIRDYILFDIGYIEISSVYTEKQCQEGIGAFIEILTLLQ